MQDPALTDYQKRFLSNKVKGSPPPKIANTTPLQHRQQSWCRYMDKWLTADIKFSPSTKFYSKIFFYYCHMHYAFYFFVTIGSPCWVGHFPKFVAWVCDGIIYPIRIWADICCFGVTEWLLFCVCARPDCNHCVNEMCKLHCTWGDGLLWGKQYFALHTYFRDDKEVAWIFQWKISSSHDS